ncbi:hypothetical protein P3X46_005101 [Hevea brasiliensis]|uniref:Aminotransferase class I/classII large domain-containing protein n=1 Tax=Hevea brasiliensis TaxID=3981 RepID=A0ABQ9MZL4_HEVBR|nr:hypothetical protein P3X46_005101 [Hevea brasiliensis]
MRTSRCFSTSTSALHWWAHVGPATKDPIITEAFLADASPVKINLGVGAYRDDKGGQTCFLEFKLSEESVKLVYGKNSDVIKEGSFAGVQALSGTGACSLFVDYHNIWRDAQVPPSTFRYYHPDLKGLNFTALMDDVKRCHHTGIFNASDGSFFLLHPYSHNPTRSMNVGLTSIFLSVLCNDMMQAEAIKSQLQKIARAMYSNPPVHGKPLVSTVLSDPDIKALWVKEVKGMANRIQAMRINLWKSFRQLGSSLNWEHITKPCRLVREFHIYMTLDGRNVNYLANAIHEVIKYGQKSIGSL